MKLMNSLALGYRHATLIAFRLKLFYTACFFIPESADRQTNIPIKLLTFSFFY